MIPLIGWFFIALLMAAGVSGALIYKAMVLVKASPVPGAEAIPFDHAYIITFFMYIGQTLNFLIVIYERQKKQKQDNKVKNKKKATFNTQHFLIFLLPTMIDVIGSTMYNISVQYALVSVCQMVRNCSVIFVAIFSAIVFPDYRQHFDLPHLIGLAMVICGITAIFLASYFCDGNQDSVTDNTLGIILCLISQIFTSVVFTIEEFVLRRITATGTQIVTSEGTWGTIIFSLVLPTLCFVYSNYEEGSPDNKTYESFAFFANQLKEKPELVAYLLTYVFTIIFYSFSGLQITSYINAVVRSLFDAAKTLIILFVSLIIGWEKWDNVGTTIKIAGYLIVLLGTMIYSDVIHIIPFMRRINLFPEEKLINITDIDTDFAESLVSVTKEEQEVLLGDPNIIRISEDD